MKKYLVILLVMVTGLSSCKKDDFDASKQAAQDDDLIQAYIKTTAATNVIKDPSGFYYQIVTPGTGNYPTSTSTVTVNYVGTLTNNNQFDAANGFKTSLTAVIRGWTLGIPHINVGGTIRLFIPSGLGYGNNVTGSIPANSVLIFTVTLVSIN